LFQTKDVEKAKHTFYFR